MMNAWLETPPNVGESVVLDWADGDEITVTRQTAGIVLVTYRSGIAATILSPAGDVWRGETHIAGDIGTVFHAAWSDVRLYV